MSKEYERSIIEQLEKEVKGMSKDDGKAKTCIRQGLVVRCFDDPDGKKYDELVKTGMYEEETLAPNR